MSDNEQGIVKNIVDKKFTQANNQFTDMMRNKVYQAVSDFKTVFKYVTHDKVQEVEPKESE